MPLVAVANAPPPLVTTPTNEAQFLRRDSRVRDSPIAEEDESTASEPGEPLTPTSHNSDSTPFTHPFSDPFRNNETPDFLTSAAAMEDGDLKQLPAATPRAPRVAPPVSRTLSNLKVDAPAEPQSSPAPEKQGIGKRVGSFVRGKLHRAASHKDGPIQHEKTKVQPKDAPKTEKMIVKTGVDGPAEVSTPAVEIPRSGRRFSSFSLSGRNTPKSSHSISGPPSPGSPNSTISHGQSQSNLRPSHKHSASSTAISNMTKEKAPGVKWAGNSGRGGKKHTWTRRRSASTEQVAKVDFDDEETTAALMATYSKPANRGVGVKARRLSLSLPDEFVVDSCELDKEFKSSSLMPGKRGKILGKGATSEVRIMARRGFGGEDLVAVKEFRPRDKDETEGDYIDKIKSEYSIAKSLHHPNIVETVRLCTNRDRWNHVMEYCAYGELFSLVERKLFAGGTEGYYSPEDRLCFFKQLLRGVDYLHSHGIAHRDIKLENLLLNKEGHLKISDFGVAEVFCGEHPGLRRAGGECGKNMGEVRLSDPGICGSLPYIAPEVLEKKGPYDPRPLDIWSCAIVYLTMTFGGCPWQAAKPDFPYYARYKKGWDEWLPNHPHEDITPDNHPKCGKLFSLINPPPLKRMMLKMLHPNPDKRITIREILDTPVIKNIACCCPESYEDPKYVIDASKSRRAAPPPKKYLHHHIPPKPEHKIAKAFAHRFDMGE
ncbi:hypothetical protein SLS60_004466 [Paraconiothyrium brasiliense]|uniref:non-specific serine/threonine protein kinase n=1 Tax=Paraconiothyrium brasiliense TaxID=300254 RepID=A0ABR3RKF8_9PLEO